MGGKRKYGKFKQESAGVDMLLFVSNASTYSLQPILTVPSVEAQYLLPSGCRLYNYMWNSLDCIPAFYGRVGDVIYVFKNFSSTSNDCCIVSSPDKYIHVPIRFPYQRSVHNIYSGTYVFRTCVFLSCKFVLKFSVGAYLHFPSLGNAPIRTYRFRTCVFQ